MSDLATTWKPSACILCECNCGIEVLVGADSQSFAKIRGDKAHPASKGYTCNKALCLDHYQHGRVGRLTRPLRRTPDGGFEEIDWDTAIAEISERLLVIRDTHGGETIFYHGGGGQGNHLGGAHGMATMAAYGARYRSSALAQEKTGEFWVSARMLGHVTRGDFEHCEVALFLGKNPYQTHGFPRARSVLKEIAKDPARSMIVIDPVRTESADLADFHLQLRPGTDLYLITAMAAVLVQEDLVDLEWIAAHTEDYEAVASVLRDVPVGAYCEVADLDEALVRATAARIAAAESVAVYEDLGVQMNRDSTLVSYVEKLVWLLTGNFAKPGAQYVPSNLSSIGRDRGLPFDAIPRSPVVGAPIISGLVPCNVIAEEILADHPARYRALIVESSNPRALIGRLGPDACGARCPPTACGHRRRHGRDRQTGRLRPAGPDPVREVRSHVLQLRLPSQHHHLRHPVLPTPAGMLAEPELHARLVEASGALSEADYAPLRDAAAQGRAAFAAAFLPLMADPSTRRLAPILLYRTLGPTLPEGAAGAAVLWAAAHQLAASNPAGVKKAGYGEAPMAGERLFDAILSGSHGIVLTDDEPEASWQRLPRERIELHLPELLDAIAALPKRPLPAPDPDFPYVLSAGERRAFTANTIIRDPSWRRRDPDGRLRISSADAQRLGVASGSQVRLTTRRGSAEAAIDVTDTMRPGHVSLPNGLGLTVTGPDGHGITTGVPTNELTDTHDRDEWVGTPWHKHVPAAITLI